MDGRRSLQIFALPQEKRYGIIGENTVECTIDGNWDKEPPIFAPIIQCDWRQI
jgi:hypothetical protein